MHFILEISGWQFAFLLFIGSIDIRAGLGDAAGTIILPRFESNT
jgi:hypothetical protein